MIISLIAALAENRVIGNKNKIPWHLKDDLQRFKQKTLHHTVIMGRTTFESLMGYYQKSGRPLPDRRHIIVSSDMNYKVDLPGCFIAHSVDEALQLAIEKETASVAADAAAHPSPKATGWQSKADVSGGEVFVSGGASIFEQTIGSADRLYLTLIHGEFEGDTYFPDYSTFKKIIGKEDKTTADGLAYTFLDLER